MKLCRKAMPSRKQTEKKRVVLVRMQADSVMGKPKPKPKARPTLTRSRNPWIHWPGEEQVKSRQVETDHNNKAENLKYCRYVVSDSEKSDEKGEEEAEQKPRRVRKAGGVEQRI